jgi:hypothetical protein
VAPELSESEECKESSLSDHGRDSWTMSSTAFVRT